MPLISDIPLYNVSKTIFWEYVRNHSLKKEQGMLVHSSNFVNETGEIKAYMETSSYGAEDIYKIADETYENYSALLFMTRVIINKNKN